MVESGSKDTIEEIFERAIQVECKAADIYEEFSQLFSHIPKISAFWRGLAEDEMQHANTLQDVRKSLTSEQLLSTCDKEMSEEVARIQRMLSDDITASIKNLDDAYELAHKLEFSEFNAIFKFLAIEFVRSEELEQFVVSGIMQHQQKLIDFNRNFGDTDWRKGVCIHAV
jgi:rubrerythrin